MKRRNSRAFLLDFAAKTRRVALRAAEGLRVFTRMDAGAHSAALAVRYAYPRRERPICREYCVCVRRLALYEPDPHRRPKRCSEE